MTMPAIVQAAAVNSSPIPLIARGSETKSAAIHWIWPGRIARAKLTLFAGAPGSGKSALAASITATVTTGGAYPCREGRAPQGSVLLVCPDGDPDVLIPRLKAAGADLGRVQLMRCKAQKDCGGLIARLTCPRSPKRRGRSRT
jgi:putative DNA primase/helicase